MISSIIPYNRNARKNERAIDAVAASIEEFGLRGQIILESPDHPVIVCGHTRVEACKRLGWTEIPDEHIAYCDDLTEDQIKAYRLADNKTAEQSHWISSLERSELDELDSVGMDMGRFGFVRAKDSGKPKEALRTAREYNLDLVSAADCAPNTGMPILEAVDVKPERMRPINYARTLSKHPEPGTYLHFYRDDYQFERYWSAPKRYVELLKRFAGCIEPDYSVYLDMPEPMQRWNVYRSAALAQYWQRQGITVVPNLTWAGPDTFSWCFDAIPRGSTVAVSARGVRGKSQAERLWCVGLSEAIRQCEPTRILLYGSPPKDADFGGIEVVRYAADTGPGRSG